MFSIETTSLGQKGRKGRSETEQQTQQSNIEYNFTQQQQREGGGVILDGKHTNS